ncbi:MAG: glycosyltransferase family 39 protein [Planctomycetaceae bacterium]|nr:glycosyltransferase family 39 protein [Planctomycetaceae bacterium]
MSAHSPCENSVSQEQREPFVSARVGVLLVALGVLCSFFAISHYRVFTLHEVLAASTSRNMHVTGNYMIPYESGVPRLRKPPLAYWIITASAGLTGRVDEFSARVPAAIFSIILAGLIGYWTATWYGKQAGWLAAFAQVTCYYSLLWSRKTEVDMCLTLVNVAALFLIANQPRGQTWKQGFLRWTGIFSLMGISVLAKFYYGPVLVFGIAGVYWLLQRRWQDVKHLVNPLGWALCLAPFGLWAWAITSQLPNAWQVWKTETLGRALGEVGYSPVWFYLFEILWITIPWTPVWIMELRRSWQLAWRDRDPRERFLWIWFLVPFVIVTLQPDKHTNYAMTFLPTLSILTGRRLAIELTPERWLAFRWSKRQTLAITMLNIVASIAAVTILLKEWPDYLITAISTGALIGVGLTLNTWLFYWGRQRQGALWSAICYTWLVMIFFGGIQPARDPWKLHAQFAEQVRDRYRDEQILGYEMSFSAGYGLGPDYWNFNQQRTETEKFLEQLSEKDSALIVAPETKEEELKQFGSLSPVMSVPSAWKQHWDGRKTLPKCWRIVPHSRLQLATAPDKKDTQ